MGMGFRNKLHWENGIPPAPAPVQDPQIREDISTTEFLTAYIPHNSFSFVVLGEYI